MKKCGLDIVVFFVVCISLAFLGEGGYCFDNILVKGKFSSMAMLKGSSILDQ